MSASSPSFRGWRLHGDGRSIENLDDVTGRALLADGLSTALAGSGGGSGATTCAENIGVMAATRVYSTAAYAMVVAIANYTLVTGSMAFEGIALGSAAAIGIYHLMRWISRVRGTNLEQASPASAPAGTELEGPAYSTRVAHADRAVHAEPAAGRED